MPPIGKLWGSRVPAWGLMLSAKGYHALMAKVAAELKSRDIAFDFCDSSVTFEASGKRAELDLKVLAESCAGKGREEWEGIVASQVDASLPPS